MYTVYVSSIAYYRSTVNHPDTVHCKEKEETGVFSCTSTR